MHRKIELRVSPNSSATAINNSPSATVVNVPGNKNATYVATGNGKINVGADSNAVYDAAFKGAQDAMKQLNDEKGPEFSKQFPLGYVIFTITQTKEIVPIQFPNKDVTADWEKSYIEMTQDSIVVHFANVKFQSVTIPNMTVDLPRQEGASFYPYMDGRNFLELTIVKSGDFGEVLVLGAK
jgi:hypothetical protein